MYENDGVQIFQALYSILGSHSAQEPILQQPVTQRHPKWTDFYELNAVLWVLEYTESICHASR